MMGLVKHPRGTMLPGSAASAGSPILRARSALVQDDQVDMVPFEDFDDIEGEGVARDEVRDELDVLGLPPFDGEGLGSLSNGQPHPLADGSQPVGVDYGVLEVVVLDGHRYVPFPRTRGEEPGNRLSTAPHKERGREEGDAEDDSVARDELGKENEYATSRSDLWMS